jgi:hypothetical protein
MFRYNGSESQTVSFLEELFNRRLCVYHVVHFLYSRKESHPCAYAPLHKVVYASKGQVSYILDL